MGIFILNKFKLITQVDYFAMLFIATISAILLTFVCYRLFQILQLSGYKSKGYFSWFKETKGAYFSRLLMLTFLSTAAVLITNVLLNQFFTVKAFEYVSVLFIILFDSFFIFILFSKKQKTPLKYTKRMTRLIITNFIVTFLIVFTLEIVGFAFIPYLSFGLLCITPTLLSIIVIVSHIINLPIEKIISNYYLKKSVQKISSFKKLKVIGITGSFGKTTLKNILLKILSEKYKVCATPENYNTPHGLSKTILNNLTEEDEVFIAEMGARYKGDIDKLCKMVSPTLGIITGVGNQHLMTFGSVENIIKTKAELADYVTNNNGELFVNIDSKNAKTLADGYKNAYLISILGQNDLKFDNIETNINGSTFDISYNGDTEKVYTSLVGEHNISNLYLACCVSIKLGLTIQDIKNGIEKLTPIPHRLEVIKSNSPYVIIDDSYNCSVEGSFASLKFLSKFDGQKIVITPGIVELGKEQYEANFELGKNLAKVCSYVIINSQTNYKAICDGLDFEKFESSKIIFTTNLSDAVEKLNTIANKGDVVLFENDLPDNYN